MNSEYLRVHCPLSTYLNEGLRVLGMSADVVREAGTLLSVQGLLPEGAHLAEVRVELVESVSVASHRWPALHLLSTRALLRAAVGEGMGRGQSRGPL